MVLKADVFFVAFFVVVIFLQNVYHTVSYTESHILKNIMSFFLIYYGYTCIVGHYIFHNKIYQSVKFQVRNLYTAEILDKKVWKITKGNNTKIMKWRVMLFLHCTCEVSSQKLKYFLIYVPDKKCGWTDMYTDVLTIWYSRGYPFVLPIVLIAT